MVTIVEAKYEISLRNQFSVFNKFRTNFEKFSKSQSVTKKSAKPKDDEFVFIPSKWQFRPDNLTEHQKEKLKEKRVDIPALYNDMSQSQDSHSTSLKPWTPKKQLQPKAMEDEIKSSDTKGTDVAVDNATVNDSQASQQASTSLDNKTNDNMNQSTPSKVDEEERKRKRMQYELNKLQMSITNPEQYSNQPRTRRMSVNLTKPEQRVLKRTLSVTPKTTPMKKTRRTIATTTTSTDNLENESVEIIEASQTPTTTPITRRGRSKRSSVSATQVLKDEAPVTEKAPDDKEIVASNGESNALLSVSVDSRSIANEAIQETEEVVIKQADKDVIKQADKDVSVDEPVEEKPFAPQDNEPHGVQASVDSDVVIVTEKSDEVADTIAIPQENNDHSPIEDAHSEVILASPVAKHSRLDLLDAETSGIITSPSTNKNCSKTTELLNSTVDISPILKATTTVDQTSESKIQQHESVKETDASTDNVAVDQIKRTELDNLIKSPMDSPMLQSQKLYNVPYSTPQSHKDPKRKFQLQGRGAQFLQLMNIRKVEEASLNVKAKVHASETATAPAETVPASATGNLLTYEDILANNKNLFRFSKVLPSPLASPSSSILSKRNINEIVETDEATESPNQKRKRVSFHDPPVSATKEFIRFAEEVNPNRMRMNRTNISPQSVRNVLTRKCRTESMNEIKKFALPFDDINSDKSEASMKSLQFDAVANDDEGVVALPLNTFSSKDEVLQHVFDEYPMEDVLGKYFASGLTLNDATSKIFSSQLTNSLKNDDAKRKLFLEDLSETFPKDFLDVAFQENLTSTVIERLPPTNMLNFIAEQAKTDCNLKVQLMEKLSSIATTSSSTTNNTEMNDDVYKLLLEIVAEKMSDKQLLEVLDLLFEKRRTNSCS